MRIALGIEYNGSRFHGWQRQDKVVTLQQTLESALSKIADHNLTIICAGRTDAGVHATHQVIHFETLSERNLEAWVFGTNRYLPSTMSVQWAKIVDDTFHARFSALSRRYQYIIYNNPVRSGLFPALTTWVHHHLDATRMNSAAKNLIGEHDFSSFRGTDCQSRSPNRHLFSINVIQKEKFIVIDVVANSFLHHMVRNIAGVLIEIGQGKKHVKWCEELLQAKNRSFASKTAPPNGLFLTGVRYADSYELPSHFKSPWLL